jgi:hypothetical protein
MSVLSKLWDRRRDRPVVTVAALVVLVALAVYPFVDWALRSVGVAAEFTFGDFGAYGGAVDRWQAGETLYPRNDDGGFWGTYLYPPVVVLLFAPFILFLEFHTAAKVWLLTSGVLLWVGLQALLAALGYDLRWYERLGLAWLLAGFHPVLLTAKLGQTAMFLAALLSVAGAALVRGGDDTDSPWPLVSGACTALVGIVKLAAAPVGAHLLHEPRRLKGAILATLPVGWLSIRLFGVDRHLTYLAVLRWGVGQGSGGARSPTLWLPPYYKPLSWLPASQAVRIAACLAVIALAILAVPRARATVFALGVAAFPLLTPQTYAYYFVALLPAAVVLLAGELDRDGRPEVVLVGLLLVHLHAYGLKFFVNSVHDAVPAFRALEPAYLLLQPGLWGNALIFCLAAVRVGQQLDPSALSLPDLSTGHEKAVDTED